MTRNHRRSPAKRSSALSSHMHTSKVRKNQPSDCGDHTFERRCTSSSQPSDLFTQQVGTREKTGHPRSRGTPCLNCMKITMETGKPTQLRKARRSRSFSFSASLQTACFSTKAPSTYNSCKGFLFGRNTQQRLVYRNVFKRVVCPTLLLARMAPLLVRSLFTGIQTNFSHAQLLPALGFLFLFRT